MLSLKWEWSAAHYNYITLKETIKDNALKNKKEYICMQVRTEYKIAHQYKVLKR